MRGGRERETKHYAHAIFKEKVTSMMAAKEKSGQAPGRRLEENIPDSRIPFVLNFPAICPDSFMASGL